MVARFDYFVVFAEMRTGSNLLESNINSFDSLNCHGEAFNPHFIGYPNKTEILGITQAMREGDPARLIDAIKSDTDGIGGFRFFHDHDPRALDLALTDPRCAKIILTRNPAESYVSWKIAQETGQWKLTNVKRRRDARATFDAAEFDSHMHNLQDFQLLLLNTLQRTGQTAFYIAYEDLNDLGVINGLAKFLGTEEALEELDSNLKIQNPQALEDKVANFDEMTTALAGLDRFNLTRTPNFEPRRGAAVPSHIVALEAPLCYMPIRSGPEREVEDWLAALDGVAPEGLHTKMNQKLLRQWMRQHPGHRCFTVLRHPIARAHAAFCHRILNRGPDCLTEIRRTLRNFHKLPIPGPGPDETYDRRAHYTAFVAFLEFLKANLRGQTSVRVDANWASQSAVLQGMAQFTLPDLILREDEMMLSLGALAKQVGYPGAPPIPDTAPDTPFTLADIYDDQIEALGSDIYQRDYIMFGFDRWA
ncbi:sulfotransferase family 2 domain-containing protein [Roseovarius pelagicus]|uniref:Sulfotransferase family 2 domain-containing protein n=1 Tax=Roseovarius pelagicus TaxID=2980108 RepID=A0ABY6D762_9RHOB|nr:sulfotransferase family 2 domain-containing protein [Roseovarius pelagicus]UXX81991.1 sulfotransferase family 2 domain-containing protein [Roseovarius pelagicus]